MIPRKKRILILTVLIILILLAIVGVLGFLYLKTDMFKSNKELFSKYLIQGIENAKILENEELLKINEKLNNNKYNSELVRKYRIYTKYSNK